VRHPELAHPISNSISKSFSSASHPLTISQDPKGGATSVCPTVI
jgi:hypothetical protein